MTDVTELAAMAEATGMEEIVLGAGVLVAGFDPGKWPADADFLAEARRAARSGRRIGLTAADGFSRFTVTAERPPLRVAGQTEPLAELEEPAAVRAELTCSLAFGSAPPQTVWDLCWIGERADGGVAAIHMPLAVMGRQRMMTAREGGEAEARVTYVACRSLGRPDRGPAWRIRGVRGGAGDAAH